MVARNSPTLEKKKTVYSILIVYDCRDPEYQLRFRFMLLGGCEVQFRPPLCNRPRDLLSRTQPLFLNTVMVQDTSDGSPTDDTFQISAPDYICVFRAANPNEKCATFVVLRGFAHTRVPAMLTSTCGAGVAVVTTARRVFRRRG